MSSRRVVVTGYGVVSSLGHDAATTWKALLAGCSGAGPLTLFDHAQHQFHIAAEVKNWSPTHWLDARGIRRSDRYQQFALVAAGEALRQSGLIISEANRDRISVLVGSSVGGFLSYDNSYAEFQTQGPRRANPFALFMVIVNGASAMIGIEYGLRGPSLPVITSCATGADNIGQAFRLIKDGTIDAAIAGGSDVPITSIGAAVLDRMGVVSHAEGSPEAAYRPFDRERDGMVMGEGAGILILEALDHAQARGAPIQAELIGYGASSDGTHLTAPQEDGVGGALAMQRALESGRIAPGELDYVNAHGTATRLNDVIETRALKRALGAAAYRVPISSTKAATGHAMGGTAAIEAVFAVQAIRSGQIPPTLNLHQPDPECDLDYVPLLARTVPIQTVMTNSFGMGGHNAALIFRAFA